MKTDHAKHRLRPSQVHNTQVHNTQHTTHNTQHTTHNTKHTTHNTQHTTHNTQHTTHNTQHKTHNTQHTSYNIVIVTLLNNNNTYMYNIDNELLYYINPAKPEYRNMCPKNFFDSYLR